MKPGPAACSAGAYLTGLRLSVGSDVTQWLAVASTALNPLVPQGVDGAPVETRVLNKERFLCVLMFASLKRELSKKFGFSGA
jgi:hypothetical protein